MAARNLRKRKQRSGDGRCPPFGTPVKRLIVDCSVVLTPLKPRNQNKGLLDCSVVLTQLKPQEPNKSITDPDKGILDCSVVLTQLKDPNKSLLGCSVVLTPLKPQAPNKSIPDPSKGILDCSPVLTPLKPQNPNKSIMDCSVVITPLQTRNPNTINSSKHRSTPAYKSIEDPKEKENFQASPIKSSVARKLLVSPPQAEQTGIEDIYKFSPVKSPNSVMPTKSFYKKGGVYVSPVERKILKVTQTRNGEVTSHPGAKSSAAKASRFTKTKKTPNQKKRLSIRRVSSPKVEKKTESGGPSTKSVEVESRPLSEQRSAILGLKMKQRPKLTVGAAFFATTKKPHSAPKKLPSHIKFMASSKSKPSLLSTTLAKGSSQALKSAMINPEKVPRTEEPKADTKTNEKVQSIPKSAPSQPKASSPEGPSACEDSALQQKQSEPHVMFDMDDSFLNPSEKKASAVYPIFSTPSVAKKRPLDLLRSELVSPVCSSTPVGAPAVLNKAPKPGKKRDSAKEDDDQLIIDAGQKHFGPITCSTCGMLYSATSLVDNTQHAQYHQRLLDSIRYVGWKKERVVAEYWDGKILMICPDDPKYALKKSEEVRELVDSELGFQQTSLNSPSRTKTYLFVTNDKKVAGCLIAESIKQAFRVIPEPVTSSAPRDQDALERHRAWRCSSEPQPAICGVSRIWVFALMRRKGIASRLVDTMRSSFIYGSHLTTDEIAFSDPTPDGKLFASTYCKIPDFLVYNFLS